MKTDVFFCSHLAQGAIATMAFLQSAVAQLPPTIVGEPQDQAVNFAADAAFTVAVEGTPPLSYQWWNGDHKLEDYEENVAGSQSSTLYLIGVGQENSGILSYHVVVTNIAGAVTSSWVSLEVRPKMVLEDHFENGLELWPPLFDAMPVGLDASRNHTSNGEFSAFITNSAQKAYRRLTPKEELRTRMTLWIYDAGGAQTAFAELCGHTGESGYARYIWQKGLWQSLSIGIYTSDFGSNNTGNLAAETMNPSNYQGRVLTGTNSGWFNLDGAGAPGRTPGWHKFQIDRSKSGTVVDFYVDDVLGKEIVDAKEGVSLDTITIGSTGIGESNNIPILPERAWFDDVIVEGFDRNRNQETVAKSGPIPDLMQLRETGTNPADVDVSVSTVEELDGAATNNGLGVWQAINSEIIGQGVRGYLNYVVNAPNDGAYRIELEGREKDFAWPPVDINLLVSLDGEDLGRVALRYGPASNGLAHCFTPYIRAGAHTIGIYWDNARPRCELALRSVRLQALTGGADANNGIPVWMANRLLAQSGLASPPSASPTSPVCLEGLGSFPSMMSLVAEADYPPTSVMIHHGAGNRWYANVALSPKAPTHVQAFYQNGGLSESNDISWRVTNLLQATNAVIRKGDSLLFTALPTGATNGAVRIHVEGLNPVDTDASAPVPCRFDEPGVFTVTGLYGPTRASASITITVIDASFNGPCPANLSVWWSWWTYWDCTNLPPGVVLDSDTRLAIYEVSAEERAERLPNAPPLGVNGREFKIESHSQEPRYILARLGINGPILASTAVLGFELAAPPTSSFRLVSTQSDGSQLLEATYVLSPLVANIRLKISVATAGVTFEDGSLSKTLTTSDFDDLGLCRVNFIRAPGLEGGACMLLQFQSDTR
jgi:hypothetical protein